MEGPGAHARRGPSGDLRGQAGEGRDPALVSAPRTTAGWLPDILARLQICYRTIPIVFADSRKFAEERTYRFLAAARSWAETEAVAAERIGGDSALADAPAAPPPSTAEVRRWARENGIAVPDKGRLRPEVHEAWRAAHSA